MHAHHSLRFVWSGSGAKEANAACGEGKPKDKVCGIGRMLSFKSDVGKHMCFSHVRIFERVKSDGQTKKNMHISDTHRGTFFRALVQNIVGLPLALTKLLPLFCGRSLLLSRISPFQLSKP